MRWITLRQRRTNVERDAPLTLRQYYELVLNAAYAWSEDRAPSMGAAIAYYTIFSLAPILILVIAIAGFVLGEEAAQGAIMAQLTGLFGPQGAAAVQTMLANNHQDGSNIIATVVALLLLAVAATTVFGELQASLNVIWKARPGTRSVPVELIKSRLIGLSLIVALGFLLLVSLVVSAALTALASYLNSVFPDLSVIMRFVNIAISLLVTTALFALVYKILPDTRVEWRDVLIASVTAALLFTLGKFVISLYIGSSSVTSTYGAAGALVTILIWVYYSAQIVLFGAEVAKTYASMFGSRRQRRRRRHQQGHQAEPTSQS